MRTEQPLWGRGVMVSPQHFQQQVAYAAWSAEGIARMGLSHPWGVINVAFESETLRLGRLQARHLHLRYSVSFSVTRKARLNVCIRSWRGLREVF